MEESFRKKREYIFATLVLVILISWAKKSAWPAVDQALLPFDDQNSALPTVRGWGSTSRMLLTPVRYITRRSKPRPKPACLQEP